MCEAFGLDRKIENYKGTRPISFYSWDLDCILDVLDMALDDEKEYPDKEDEGYIRLHELYVDLKKAYRNIWRLKQAANNAIGADGLKIAGLRIGRARLGII